VKEQLSRFASSFLGLVAFILFVFVVYMAAVEWFNPVPKYKEVDFTGVLQDIKMLERRMTKLENDVLKIVGARMLEDQHTREARQYNSTEKGGE